MKFPLLPLAAVFAITPAVHAEEAGTLPEILVTATRSTEVAPILPTSSVITRQDIATRQPSSITELLQQEAGINVGSNGGPLTVNSVFLRGNSSKQVLILVDGVRVNDANQGGFDISLIRPDDIERVEISRGAYSSQYGSDAIGGVIQIFTRKSSQAEASIRAGSFGTQEYNAGASLGDSRNGLSIRGGYLSTDGFSATNENAYAFNPDDDGGLARSGMLSGQAQWGSRVDASFNTSWKSSSIEIDNGITDQELGTAAVNLRIRTTERWTQRLQLGWLRDNIDTDNHADPAPFSAYYTHFLTERDSLGWLHDVQWSEGWKLVGGVDYYSEHAESRDLLADSTNFDKKLDNTGIFLSQYGEHGIFSGNVALREDFHETFGNHTTGSMALAAQLLPQARVFAAYGTAFRAPSANDLYYPGFFGSYGGNPDLQPEESEQTEVGTELELGGHRLRLSAYHNRMTDMISPAPTAPNNAMNIASATLQGLELDISGKIERLSYNVNASQQSAKDNKGTWLAQRPKSSLNLTAGYDFTDSINAGAEIRARSDSMSEGVELPGYTLANLHASWRVVPAFTLGARVENLGNKEYEVVRGYNTAARSAYLTASYRWR